MSGAAPDTWVQSMISRFEADNAALVAPTRSLLRAVIPTPATHARFLNTLSMLEHMGGQKIMATQHGAAIDQPTLKHIAEETRHAFFFKRKAEHLAGRALAYVGPDLLSPASTGGYFRRLEATLKRALATHADRRLTYLYMSLAIEFRAVWAYGIYQQELNHAGALLSLKSLLAEENGHMGDMTRRIAAVGALDLEPMAGFCAVERRLFERMLEGFSQAIAEPEADRAPRLAAAVGALSSAPA